MTATTTPVPAPSGAETRTEDPATAANAGGRLRSSRLPTVLLTAALVAALALSGWLLLERREAGQVATAREEATAQARVAAVALTSYDHATLARDFDAVRDLAVDPFASQFEKASRTLTEVLEKYEGTADGKVVRAAVSSADEGRVQVLLFVDQTVTSAMQEQPRVDRNRIAMTLVRTDDGWRVSEAELL